VLVVIKMYNLFAVYRMPSSSQTWLGMMQTSHRRCTGYRNLPLECLWLLLLGCATNGLIVWLMSAHLTATLSAHVCISVKDMWPIAGVQDR
jgi:hypothetical protein